MRSILQSEEKNDSPIGHLMDGAFGKMRSLTDTEMIVGEPISMPDGTTVIPISKISLGIVSGGGEYNGNISSEYPFAGASGAGMSIEPVCFLVGDGRSVRMLSVGTKSVTDKAIDIIPGVIASFFGKKK